jgi:dTDP-4-amino-4,6-dideoxygalactose transaminase
VHLRRDARQAPFPFQYAGTRLFARARHALWHGLRAADVASGDEVLTPAYHCGAEVEAIIAAGLVPRFYDVGDTLTPERQELESLLTPRTRALLIIHYFGFPQALASWRRWCNGHGLLLIEDCAQALYTRDGDAPVGSAGELAIFSFAKTLPLPDGAALVSRTPVDAPGGPQPSLLPVLKRHMQWAMSRSAPLDARLAGFEREAADEFELGDPSRGPARATRYLLPRLPHADVRECRRANYRRLLESARTLVPPSFDRLPSGASPLVFPVEAGADADLEQRLARARIEARRFWPVAHPALAPDRFPGAAAWRRRLLALPVHQELRSEELARIIAALG